MIVFYECVFENREKEEGSLSSWDMKSNERKDVMVPHMYKHSFFVRRMKTYSYRICGKKWKDGHYRAKDQKVGIILLCLTCTVHTSYMDKYVGLLDIYLSTYVCSCVFY